MPTDFKPVREPDGSLSIATQQAITNQLYQYLDEYSIEQSPLSHREHLGVSIIGEKCSRKLWYSFRWVKLEQFEPRMRRLFKRGHSEESKFQKLLLWMGFYIRNIDLNKQPYKFSSVNGHYGGTGDNVMLLPWWQNDEQFRILVEYKTHNKKSFDKLKADKLKIAKPQHYIQMCSYGQKFGTRYGLYCAINKDDDDIYFEFLELDWNLATLMEKKAADIIGSQLPPPRISDNASWYECKYCDKAGICHHGEAVEINCRSCKMAIPVESGKWYCNQWKAIIPANAILKACTQHQSINT